MPRADTETMPEMTPDQNLKVVNLKWRGCVMSEPSAQNNQRITLEIFYCSIIVIVFKKKF